MLLEPFTFYPVFETILRKAKWVTKIVGELDEKGSKPPEWSRGNGVRGLLGEGVIWVGSKI